MDDVLALMIPIIAIVLGIGTAFWSIYWDHQKKRLQYQERQLMIEKGMTPPPVLPDQPKKKDRPRRIASVEAPCCCSSESGSAQRHWS